MQHLVCDLLPASIKRGNEPVFEAPWQAQAFAMAVTLIETGQLELTEWAQALGAEIANARANGFADDGSDYYALWLRALEQQVVSHDMAAAAELDSTTRAWRSAYANTPHGEPVSLHRPAATNSSEELYTPGPQG